MSQAKRICVYRNCAEELRTLAEVFAQESMRQRLHQIAATYDLLADDAARELGFPIGALVCRASRADRRPRPQGGGGRFPTREAVRLPDVAEHEAGALRNADHGERAGHKRR